VQKSRGSKPNQGVNASNIKVVQLLDGKLDLCHIGGVTKLPAAANLVLVGTTIDDEDDGVVLLDLLKGGLCPRFQAGALQRAANKPVVRGCLTTV
jgi:hypothetical protein